MQATEPQITVETAKKLGLTEEEFTKAIQALGRMPNFTELAVFSALWLEPCSHKSSLFWLKTLPKEGKLLPVGPNGEPGCLADIGDGMACALRIDSGRLSAPGAYQAATALASGVQADIFALGARPAVLLNALSFSSQGSPGIASEAIRSIGASGSSFGTPVVGGEAHVEDGFAGNELLVIMSAGLLEERKSISTPVIGPGSPVFIAGAASTPDGAHKAAAGELPALQPASPFQAKQLMEAALEALEAGAALSMQPVGIGGIARSSVEMMARTETGMRISLDEAPIGQPGMQAFEILLSENRNRLLIIGKKGEENKLPETFGKWNLECTQIGETSKPGQLEVHRGGELIAGLPAYLLAAGKGAPVYQPEFRTPAYLKKARRFNISQIPFPKDYRQAARQLMANPNIISRRWIFEQYDSTARAGTLSGEAPSDAALLRLEGSPKALAFALVCKAAYVQADPYTGAMIAVAEAARNISCSGGEPLAAAASLNFGSHHEPEKYWQFVQAVKGIGDACRRLGAPVADSTANFSGQLSTQEEPAGGPFPIPAIGMAGTLEDIDARMTLDFKQEGHHIYMIGTPQNDLSSSGYLRRIVGILLSAAPFFDIDEEYHIQQNLRKLIRKGLLKSAHGISAGGLFAALMESAFPRELGFDIETDGNFRKDAYLFGESQGRILVSVASGNEDELVNHLNSHNVSFTKLGEVIGKEAIIDGENYGLIQDWKKNYDSALHQKMEY